MLENLVLCPFSLTRGWANFCRFSSSVFLEEENRAFDWNAKTSAIIKKTRGYRLSYYNIDRNKFGENKFKITLPPHLSLAHELWEYSTCLRVLEMRFEPNETHSFMGLLDKCGLSGGKFFYCFDAISGRRIVEAVTSKFLLSIHLIQNPDRNSSPDWAPKTYQWDVCDVSSTKKKDPNAAIFTVPCERSYSYHWLHFDSNKTLKKCSNYRALCIYAWKFT